jgi:carbamate kinase
MARIVVALGGNALGKSYIEQKNMVRNTANSIVELVENGHNLILTHGNGPQVGMINLAFEISAKHEKNIIEMPFPECGSMSQGYIGYHLQNALQEELKIRGIEKSIATIITQVVVHKNDPAFFKPTKPIGNFYTEKEAKELVKLKGYNMVEDAGRGYRRVVPSPIPIDIVEKEIIKTLVDREQIVIACGGGGIPVIREGNSLEGVPAVIDKDFASEKLAELVNADMLVILTAVDKIALNFGTPQEKYLSEMNIEMAKKYCEEGHFAPGSMLPKVKAAIKFVEGGKDRKALITSLEKAKEGLLGKNGTIIKN